MILVLAVFVVAKWGLRRDERTGTPIGVALILFGLLFDVLITEGKAFYAYLGASQSRYVTYDVMVVVGIYLATLGDLHARVVTRIALAAMAIQLAFGLHYGLEGARTQHQVYVTSANLTRNIDHESDATIRLLNLGESPQMIRGQAAFLREHHLSLYR